MFTLHIFTGTTDFLNFSFHSDQLAWKYYIVYYFYCIERTVQNLPILSIKQITKDSSCAYIEPYITNIYRNQVMEFSTKRYHFQKKLCVLYICKKVKKLVLLTFLADTFHLKIVKTCSIFKLFYLGYFNGRSIQLDSSICSCYVYKNMCSE